MSKPVAGAKPLTMTWLPGSWVPESAKEMLHSDGRWSLIKKGTQKRLWVYCPKIAVQRGITRLEVEHRVALFRSALGGQMPIVVAFFFLPVLVMNIDELLNVNREAPSPSTV